MHRFGFTGTRSIKERHHRLIEQVLVERLPARASNGELEFHTGGAYGSDTYIAEFLINRYPQSHHVAHLPRDGPYNPAVKGMPFTERRFYQSYRQRNGGIVGAAELLVAFPLHEEHREPRSGTWMTVRMARRTRRPYVVTILEPLEE